MRAILVVLFMGLFLVQSGQTQQEGDSAQRGTEDQQAPAQSLYPPIRVEIVEDQAEANARKSREAESRQNEIDDLIAQRGMDDASQRMAFYSKWQTIAAWVGAFLVAGTLLLMIQANKAAVKAAGAAEQSNIDQRAFHIEQTRPFLDWDGEITAEVMNGPGGRYLFLRYKVANIGQSPAVNVRGHFKLCFPLFGQGSAKDTADFATSCTNEMGTAQQIIPHNASREFRHSGNKPAAIPDEGFNGWLVFFGVTYQRGGHDEVYYIARQLRIEPADARRAFNGRGTAKVKARLISGVDAAK